LYRSSEYLCLVGCTAQSKNNGTNEKSGYIQSGSRKNSEIKKEQKDEIFPQMVKDDTFLISDAITEPNSGTDSILMGGVPGLAMQTYAERRGDEYVINGSKHFVSNAACQTLSASHTNGQETASQSMPQHLLAEIGYSGALCREIP
jgi:hypothetical protein